MASAVAAFGARAVALHVGSSWTRDWTPDPCIGRWILNHWTPRKTQYLSDAWLAELGLSLVLCLRVLKFHDAVFGAGLSSSRVLYVSEFPYFLSKCLTLGKLLYEICVVCSTLGETWSVSKWKASAPQSSQLESYGPVCAWVLPREGSPWQCVFPESPYEWPLGKEHVESR